MNAIPTTRTPALRPPLPPPLQFARIKHHQPVSDESECCKLLPSGCCLLTNLTKFPPLLPATAITAYHFQCHSTELTTSTCDGCTSTTAAAAFHNSNMQLPHHPATSLPPPSHLPLPPTPSPLHKTASQTGSPDGRCAEHSLDDANDAQPDRLQLARHAPLGRCECVSGCVPVCLSKGGSSGMFWRGQNDVWGG